MEKETFNEEFDGSTDNHLDPGMKMIINNLKRQGVITLFSCTGHWKEVNGKKYWNKPYLVFDINEDFAKYVNKYYKVEFDKLYSKDDKESKKVMSIHPEIKSGDKDGIMKFWNYIMGYKKVLTESFFRNILMEAVVFNTGEDVYNALIGGKISGVTVPVKMKESTKLGYKFLTKFPVFCQKFIDKLKENNVPQNEIKNIIILILKQYKMNFINYEIEEFLNTFETFFLKQQLFDGVLAYIYNRKKPKSPEIQKLFDDFETNAWMTIKRDDFEQEVNKYFDTDKGKSTKKEYNVEYIYPSKKPEPSYKGWEIYIPKDFEAAQNASWLIDPDGHRTEKTHWCTAADRNYFDSYTRKGPLYIFRNNHLKLMMQFNGTKVMDSKNDVNFDKVSFLDFNDRENEIPKGLRSVLKEVPKEALVKVWGNKIVDRLINEVGETDKEKKPNSINSNERKIWDIKTQSDIPGVINSIIKILNISGSSVSVIKKFLNVNYDKIMKIISNSDNDKIKGMRIALVKDERISTDNYELIVQALRDDKFATTNYTNRRIDSVKFKVYDNSIVNVVHDYNNDGYSKLDADLRNIDISNKRDEVVRNRKDLIRKKYDDSRERSFSLADFDYITNVRGYDGDLIVALRQSARVGRHILISKPKALVSDNVRFIYNFDRDNNQVFTPNEFRAKYPKIWKELMRIPQITNFLRENNARASVKTTNKVVDKLREIQNGNGVGNNKKWNKLLKEEVYGTSQNQKTPVFRNLLQNRGVMVVLANEKYLPDETSRVPNGLDAYGRGGVDRRTGKVWMDGGATGSKSGHPNFIFNNFYWGAKYDENYIDPKTKKTYRGIIYISGKTRDSENWIIQHVIEILTEINRRLPANTSPEFRQFRRMLEKQQPKAASVLINKNGRLKKKLRNLFTPRY